MARKKFIESHLVQKIWFKKMEKVNTMSPEEVEELMETVCNEKLSPSGRITVSARDKLIKNYTESNASYLWISVDVMSISNRYKGKIVFAHILHREFSDVLTSEEITEHLVAGDIELANKLGLSKVDTNPTKCLFN